MTNGKIQVEEYQRFDKSNSDILKRVRGEASRYKRIKLDTYFRRPKSAASSILPITFDSPGSSYSGHLRRASTNTQTDSAEGSPVLSESNGLTRRPEKDVSQIIENVISVYINQHRQVEYSPGLIHVCGPFSVIIKEESDIYFCFERMMELIG